MPAMFDLGLTKSNDGPYDLQRREEERGAGDLVVSEVACFSSLGEKSNKLTSWPWFARSSRGSDQGRRPCCLRIISWLVI